MSITPAGARALGLGTVGALAALAGGIVSWTGVLDRVETDTIATRFAVRGTQAPGRITVVGVDNATLYSSGFPDWPWPRKLQARLLDDVAALHPRLIVYDIQILAPTTPAQDAALYEAVSRARPVVMVTSVVGPHGATPILGGNRNLARAGALPAFAGVPQNSDEEVTRLEAGFHGLPSVPFVVARALGRPVTLAAHATPLIDYPGGPHTVPEVSAIDLLRHRVPAAALRGRIVVVGVPATGVGDQHPTDAGGGSQLSGPEIQADAIATVLHGFPLSGAAGGLDALFVLISALLPPAIASRGKAYAGAIGAIVWLALGTVLAQLLFDGGVVLRLMPPLVAVLVSGIGVVIADLSTVRRHRAQLAATFARYVPSAHVDQVVDRAEQEAGLADVVDATVMFCDLRGYTAFAEHLDPRELLTQLNRYLGQVSDAVMDEGGSVVTFLGDGVMAVFGAPLASDDHAARGLAAARAVLATVGAERVGIGLASGPVVSGTVGSGRRLEYAAIGDTTNVAARVQALTRETDRPILLTDATRERLPPAEQGRLEALGEFTLRGREQPLALYAVR